MNVVGMRTLLRKEVRRFMRVPGQTVLSPLVSTSLYFLVFGYALGGRGEQVTGVAYTHFIVPGLIFLGVANNAFLNSSSSLFQTKLQGTIVDLLVAPLGPLEIMVGFVGGAMIRGLAVGLLTWAVAIFFVGFELKAPGMTLLMLLLIPYTFSILGLLAGLWAQKFEEINIFPTFVMLPLTFLGGVFYSVRDLPQPWQTVSLFNPIVYMVDGLRHGLLGVSVLPAIWGVVLLLPLAVVGTFLAYRALQTGYRVRQ